MKVVAFSLLLAAPLFSDTCRVLVDGAGCRTRQLAIKRIFEKLPEITEVATLPPEDAPALNQRYFIVKTENDSPTLDELVEALGRRAKHYQIVSVTPQPSQ